MIFKFLLLRRFQQTFIHSDMVFLTSYIWILLPLLLPCGLASISLHLSFLLSLSISSLFTTSIPFRSVFSPNSFFFLLIFFSSVSQNVHFYLFPRYIIYFFSSFPCTPLTRKSQATPFKSNYATRERKRFSIKFVKSGESISFF